MSSARRPRGRLLRIRGPAAPKLYGCYSLYGITIRTGRQVTALETQIFVNNPRNRSMDLPPHVKFL